MSTALGVEGPAIGCRVDAGMAGLVITVDPCVVIIMRGLITPTSVLILAPARGPLEPQLALKVKLKRKFGGSLHDGLDRGL